jgi:hypothetical protein
MRPRTSGCAGVGTMGSRMTRIRHPKPQSRHIAMVGYRHSSPLTIRHVRGVKLRRQGIFVHGAGRRGMVVTIAREYTGHSIRPDVGMGHVPACVASRVSTCGAKNAIG